MKNSRNKQVFADCLKKHRLAFIIYIISLIINLLVFWLYGLFIEPFLYSFTVMTVLLAVLFTVSYLKELKYAKERERLSKTLLSDKSVFPTARNLSDKDYHEIICSLADQCSKTVSEYEKAGKDMLDYYTVWVHQIKTPIAVLHMLLAEEDTEEHRKMSVELFRIEQYVEMVLQYIRLDADSNDLVIKEYSLDDTVRKSVRKYASQFIAKKIRLDFTPTNQTVVTDAKWLGTIIEQLLSNAVKYTGVGGEVKIYGKDGKLYIEDNGIGIAPEDLPLIFNKGYTGVNGRAGEKSSGLGLYLCRRAAEKLAVSISAQSVVGEGSVFILELNK